MFEYYVNEVWRLKTGRIALVVAIYGNSQLDSGLLWYDGEWQVSSDHVESRLKERLDMSHSDFFAEAMKVALV